MDTEEVRLLQMGDWVEITKEDGEKVEGFLIDFIPPIGLLISTERPGIFNSVDPEKIKEIVFYDEPLGPDDVTPT